MWHGCAAAHQGITASTAGRPGGPSLPCRRHLNRALNRVANPPDPVNAPGVMWTTAQEFEDIRYETTDEGQIAKITINRPEVRNAFTPKTVAWPCRDG